MLILNHVQLKPDQEWLIKDEWQFIEISVPDWEAAPYK